MQCLVRTERVVGCERPFRGKCRAHHCDCCAEKERTEKYFCVVSLSVRHIPRVELIAGSFFFSSPLQRTCTEYL